MKRKKRMVLFAALMAVFIFTGCGTGSEEGGSSENGGNGSGREFGAFEAELFGGGVTGDKIFEEAEVTMVNVWATYCGYCIDEMPYFKEFSEAYNDRGFQVVGIVTDAAPAEDEAVGRIIEETGADYPQIVFNRSMFDTYLKDVQAVPATVFVDKNGKIIEEYLGAKSREDWEKIIEELL